MSYTWSGLSEKLIASAKEKKIPLIGQFELTSRCNLKCSMCYVCSPANSKKAIGMEHSAKEWIRLAEDARDAGMLYLLLTGGEVFLRDDFKEIYQALTTMGLCIEIYTNATMVTPETVRWLSRMPPLKIGVTLYGASAETYKKVCGYDKGYEAAVNGIELLMAEGIPIELKTTLIESNIDDFDQIADFAESRGIEFGIVDYVTPRRGSFDVSPGSGRLSPKELAKHEIHVINYYKEKGMVFSDLDEKCYNNEYIDDINQSTAAGNLNSTLDCAAGGCSFWVSWDGKMSPCGIMQSPFVLPFTTGFRKAWEDLQQYCLNIPVCSECVQCNIKRYCKACPAMLESETGSFDKPARYFCEWAENRKSLNTIYKI